MNTVKREAYYAAIAVVLVLTCAELISDWILPEFNNWRYAENPYGPIENISMERDGRILTLSGDLTKTANCDPGGQVPAFWLWRWGANEIATERVFLNGKPLVSQNVIQVGETVRVGALNATVPEEAVDFPATIALLVTCDRGDGKPRTYELQPQVEVPMD